MERCKDCKFWRPHDEGSPDGLCRRYPPQDGLKFESGSGWVKIVRGRLFNETFQDEWCGEFVRRVEGFPEQIPYRLKKREQP